MTPASWDNVLAQAVTALGIIIGAIVTAWTVRNGRQANEAAKQASEGASPTDQLLRSLTETMRRVDKLEDRVTMLEAELAIAVQFIRELVAKLISAGIDIPIVPESLRRHLIDLIRGREADR